MFGRGKRLEDMREPDVAKLIRRLVGEEMRAKDRMEMPISELIDRIEFVELTVGDNTVRIGFSDGRIFRAIIKEGEEEENGS